MFIGHVAVGFASKRLAPRTSLAVLLAAPLFADILWPVLVLAGVERVRIVPGATAFTPLVFDSYPWSHSLVMDVAWGALFGGVVWAVSKDRTASLVVAAGVVSHWVLDWITHAPDMPLYPGGPVYGLGLWNSVAGTMLVEGLMFLAGVTIYVKATRATDRIGAIAWWALVGLLAVLYVANSTGKAPPTVSAIAITGVVGAVVFAVWAWWADRHRVARVAP